MGLRSAHSPASYRAPPRPLSQRIPTGLWPWVAVPENAEDSEQFDRLNSNDDRVLPKRPLQILTVGAPPRPIYVAQHHLKDQNLVVRGLSLFVLPHTLSRRLCMGGQAAEALHQFMADFCVLPGRKRC